MTLQIYILFYDEQTAGQNADGIIQVFVWVDFFTDINGTVDYVICSFNR